MSLSERAAGVGLSVAGLIAIAAGVEDAWIVVGIGLLLCVFGDG